MGNTLAPLLTLIYFLTFWKKQFQRCFEVAHEVAEAYHGNDEDDANAESPPVLALTAGSNLNQPSARTENEDADNVSAETPQDEGEAAATIVAGDDGNEITALLPNATPAVATEQNGATLIPGATALP